MYGYRMKYISKDNIYYIYEDKFYRTNYTTIVSIVSNTNLIENIYHKEKLDDHDIQFINPILCYFIDVNNIDKNIEYYCIKYNDLRNNKLLINMG